MTDKKVERRRALWNKMALSNASRLKMVCFLEGCLIDPVSEEELKRNTNLYNILVGNINTKADMLPPLRELYKKNH